MISKKISFIAILVFCLAILYFFMFTPLGVHTFGETLFGGKEAKAYEPQDYPTEVYAIKPIARTIELPSKVKQPSGIDFDEKENAFFLVTDQAEIMELTEDLKDISSSVTISNKPLLFRQGSVESIDCYENKMYIGGDLGVIEIWEKTSNDWRKTGSVKPQTNQGVNVEAEALAINPSNGNIYIGADNTITVINQQGKFTAEFALQMTAKSGRSVSEYIIAGMDFYKGALYVLTEYHSAILMVNPSSGEINAVYALEGITEGAGLAVTEEAFFVVVDHELNEASPGVKMYRRQVSPEF